MKYTFALAALAGIAAAQPHVGHQRLHKKDTAKTVTDWTIVTVTDVVTVFGPSPVATPPAADKPAQAPPAKASSPAPQPTSKPADPPKQPAQSPANPPAQPPASPPAQTPAKPADTPAPKPADPPAQPKPSPPAQSPASPPAQSPSKPDSGSSSGGQCSSGQPCTGDMTTYTAGMGACGHDDSAPNDQNVVALSKPFFDKMTPNGNPNNNPYCNKQIMIKNPATGVTAKGVIRDSCPGCTGTIGLDLSPPLWAALNANGPGDRRPVEWYFI